MYSWQTEHLFSHAAHWQACILSLSRHATCQICSLRYCPKSCALLIAKLAKSAWHHHLHLLPAEDEDDIPGGEDDPWLCWSCSRDTKTPFAQTESPVSHSVPLLPESHPCTHAALCLSSRQYTLLCKLYQYHGTACCNLHDDRGGGQNRCVMACVFHLLAVWRIGCDACDACLGCLASNLVMLMRRLMPRSGIGSCWESGRAPSPITRQRRQQSLVAS